MAKTEKSAAEKYREERKKRIAKANKKNSKKSISSQSAERAGKVISIVLVIAILAAVCGVVVNQAGLIEKSRTAFYIDGEAIKQPEYEFYYMSGYNTVYQYASSGYLSFDTSTPASSQEYTGAALLGEIDGFPEDQTPTWADYLEYSARRQLVYQKAALKLAKEAGIEADAAVEAEVESEVDELTENAKSSNYSAGAYLKANYGKGMSLNLYKRILTDQQLVSKYAEQKQKEMEDDITDKEIKKEFNDNLTNYARVSVLSYTIPAATEKGDDETESATKATLKVAENEAKAIAKASNQEEFKALAKQNSKADENAAQSEVVETEDASYSSIQDLSTNEGFLTWAFSKDTKVNDTYVYNDETSQSMVFMMTNPVHTAPNSATYDSRHILIQYEDADEETTNELTDDEVADSEDKSVEEEAEIEVKKLDLSSYGKLDFVVDDTVDLENTGNKEAYQKALDVLDEYLKGEHTEDAFAELANKYSEDTGSNTSGGLYEDTAVGQFVAPYEDWCLQDGRKAGDIGVVEYNSDGNYKGYHIIYYIGQSETTWKDEIKTVLASTAYNDYAENLLAESPQPEDINESTTQKVVDFLDKIIKRNAANAAASEAAY